MVKAVKTENWLNLIFKVLICITNQKINEYWQISVWLSKLALYNSYVKWCDLDFEKNLAIIKYFIFNGARM